MPPNKLLATLSLAVCLSAMLLVGSGCERQPTARQDVGPKATNANQQDLTVSLQIDFMGRGENLEIELEVPTESTVFDLLDAARAGGKLDFESSGEGELAFVHSIGGVKNELGDGSNWVFYVNGELAKRGSGSQQLDNSDKVQWKFKPDGLK